MTPSSRQWTLPSIIEIFGSPQEGLPSKFYMLSTQEYKSLAQALTKWDSTPCFPQDTLSQVCHAGDPTLVKEVLCRTISPVDTTDGLYNLLLDNEKVSKKKKFECCKLLLPFAPNVTLSQVLAIAAERGIDPLVTYMMEKYPQAQSQMDDEDFHDMMLNILSDGAENESACLNTIASLLKNKEEGSFDEWWLALLTASMEAGPEYVRAVAPFFKKIIFPKALVHYLDRNTLQELSGAPDTQKVFKQIVEMMYEKSQDFFLSFEDEQLKVFLSDQSHPYFWSLHTTARLRNSLATSTSQSKQSKPQAPSKKM